MDVEVRCMFVDIDGVRKYKKTIPTRYKSYFNKLTKVSDETMFICEPIAYDCAGFWSSCDDELLLELFKQKFDSAVCDLMLKPKV